MRNTLYSASIFVLAFFSITSFANNPVSIEYVNKIITEFLTLIDNTTGPAGPPGVQGPTGQGVTTYTIGQQVFGGKVFWLDTSDPSSANQHGLIVTNEDVGNFPWSTNTTVATFAKNDGVGGGTINTILAMAKQSNGTASAVGACANYAAHADGVTPCWEPGGITLPLEGDSCYSDWYLPSFSELVLLAKANQDYPGSFGTLNLSWSSNEASPTGAFGASVQSFPTVSWLNNKTAIYAVRCIRSF